MPSTAKPISPWLANSAKKAKESSFANRTLSTLSQKSRPLVLPPDYSREQFLQAVDELKKELGESHVVVVEGILDDGWYLEHPNAHDGFSIMDQDDLVASCVVYPGNVEDVQIIVRWANKFLVPLWPISIGRNLGYGGAAPRVRGSVVIDLGHRMNSILSIDEKGASCLIEPGVTYYKLYDELQARKSNLWIDTPDLPGGSVMGNCLDRGVGYTPYGDHWANHCGMEIVTPNGNLVRTGMGAIQDSSTWQAFQHGFGPSVDGLFSQSNMGIVTKIGMW